MTDPAEPHRLGVIADAQVAWLQARNKELDVLASTHRVGRAVRLASIPLDPLTPAWTALDERAGFTRLWEASVARIRDQVALSTMDMLREAESRRRSS
ncbi:hypothetical protein [Paractinoplanes rishiriensis]|uniref:Uncharacterized protein n=1 Tax=Paractinoplanes rishiriensis TaxID=1050105 RepID=A0A919K816_9ACTN|nr:hypothetical protein [Actinoplanes rishiriensis]GIF00400.1 hypothetical protein Ari01nite_78640 [Actinoplanes rishiriensis]